MLFGKSLSNLNNMLSEKFSAYLAQLLTHDSHFVREIVKQIIEQELLIFPTIIEGHLCFTTIKGCYRIRYLYPNIVGGAHYLQIMSEGYWKNIDHWNNPSELLNAIQKYDRKFYEF